MSYAEMKPAKMFLLCVVGGTALAVGRVYTFFRRRRLKKEAALREKLLGQLFVRETSTIDARFDEKH